MALRLITGPATEPVTLAEAKAHLRAGDDEDTLIEALIAAARECCEQELRRALITQEWAKTLDAFPDCGGGIRLDNPPLITVDSIAYTDENGDAQTLSGAAYSVDSQAEPGWIVPAYGYDWPATYDEINSVTISYTAGYGAAAAVPKAIKQWILLMVGHYYENREASGAKMEPLPFLGGLLDRYRIYTL
jgi:uncharacterized phiE125 gp8 family phage protein